VDKTTPETEVNQALEAVNQFDGSLMAVTPEIAEARIALSSGKVPAHAVLTRPGRGKSLTYMSHVYATEVIQRGLLPTWSFELLNYEIFEEVKGQGKAVMSVLALTRFTYRIPFTNPDGSITWIPRVVTFPGNFINDLKIPKAPAVAAATSRGLCGCLMRLFGLGLEFYKNGQDEMSPDKAYSTIFTFAQNNNVTEQRLHEIMMQIGITQENIVDRFTDLFDAVSATRNEAQAVPFPTEMPQAQPVQSSSGPVWQTGNDVLDYAASLNLNVEMVKTELARINPNGYDPIQAAQVYDAITRMNQDDRFKIVPPAEPTLDIQDDFPFEPDPASKATPAPVAVSPTVGEIVLKPVEEWKNFGHIKDWLTVHGKTKPEEIATAITAITDKFGPEMDYDRCGEYAAHLSELYQIPVPVAG